MMSVEFSMGVDDDYLGGGKTLVVFQDKDIDYRIEGFTHGLASHSLKHLREFLPDTVHDILNSMRAQLRKIEPIYIYNGYKKRVTVRERSEVLKHLNDDRLINTLDYINDKVVLERPLSDLEKMFVPVIDQMAELYEGVIKHLLNNSQCIDDVSHEQLFGHLSDPVWFTVYEKGEKHIYFIDMNNSSFMIMEHGKVLTLFKADNLIEKLKHKADDFRFENKDLDELFENDALCMKYFGV